MAGANTTLQNVLTVAITVKYMSISTTTRITNAVDANNKYNNIAKT